MNFGTWHPKGNQFLYGFVRPCVHFRTSASWFGSSIKHVATRNWLASHGDFGGEMFVRVVFSCASSSSSSSSSSPTAMIEARCFLPGPQPRWCELSVPCRTSTTIMWAQCSVPDLNHDHVSSVSRAGPQPRSCELSVPCRTSTARWNVRKNVGRLPAVSTSVCEALALYCRRCKLEELENCRWAGSCNGNRRMRASLRMLRQPWDLSNRKLAKTKVSSTAVQVGNGLHRCSKLYKCPEWQAAESFGCGHKRTWNGQLWPQLEHSPAVHLSSRKLHALWVFWNVMAGITRRKLIFCKQRKMA